MSNSVPYFIIAIDGPAASGKGTLAHKLAEHYQISYLDTGLSYRAVAYEALQKNIALDQEDNLLKLAQNINFQNLDRKILSQHHIGQGASKIAIFPKLRRILVKKQRDFVRENREAVLDGRDIGTVVCPEAQVKFFITADVEIRAKRRFEQLCCSPYLQGDSTQYQTILQDLKNRDERDRTRSEGPLIAAQDAVLLDTSKMSILKMFNYAIDYIDPFWQNRFKH